MILIKQTKSKKFTFILYKSLKFGFLRFDEGLPTDWWLDVGPLAILKTQPDWIKLILDKTIK